MPIIAVLCGSALIRIKFCPHADRLIRRPTVIAHAALERFATEHGLTVAASYVENESGAKLERPELFRLLKDSRPGDTLLVEQVDRLSRLTDGDWKRLRAEVDARQVRSRWICRPPGCF